MSEPTTADLAKMIETLTTSVTSLQASMAQLQKEKYSSSSSGPRDPDGQHHHDRPPRFQKMDFSRYHSTTDPLIFLNRCESYFHQERIMEEEKVWMASYNLEDGAQMWYIQVQTDEGTPSWNRFKELMNLRYGPPLRSAPLAELAECRRTGTVAEYQDQFQALLPRAGPLRESQRVQLFTGGLQPPLSIDVQIQNPQSLAAAMSLARQFELREQYAAPAPRAPSRPLLPAPAPRLALPAPLGPRAAAPATISVAGRQIKRLTQAEQEERRRKGLCYNCDEKYTRGHNRVCQQLFLLEGLEADDADGIAEESEEAAAEDAPVFSLQALAGVSFADTMQIAVTLGSTALVALLDSGSTHNFISEAAAQQSRLPLQQRPRLTAMVANGERVACVEVIRSAPRPSTAPRSLPTSSSCHWRAMTWSSAPGGSAHWAPSFGTSLGAG
ncbi:hypothetical protein U9M48_019632 [Paspalum notatum var. saurae]|uniref:Retrotransposon gag domain-containing protein n=1 Tax=Paspalum notatum var. saurae TaxID=547442 RepID=A0AAQ3WRE8_PASNO